MMKIYERVRVEISEGAVNFDSCGGDSSDGRENGNRGRDVSVPPITPLLLALIPPITTPVVPAKS